jgi:acyl-CoA-dependent ceramide synthase
VAKCLKYLGYSKLCDFVFGLFMLTWVIARHVLYIMVCWSVYSDIPQTIEYGCYKGKNGSIIGPFPAPDRFQHLIEPFRDPEGVVCWNDKIKWGFLTALILLQAITLMWFWLICQVAVKVLRGGEADDSRSDDEEYEDIDQDICEVAEPVKMVPLEEEVGVEAINLKGRTVSSKRYRKGVSSASGVTLPGHSDRKELLGRIGCDKGV